MLFLQIVPIVPPTSSVLPLTPSFSRNEGPIEVLASFLKYGLNPVSFLFLHRVIYHQFIFSKQSLFPVNLLKTTSELVAKTMVLKRIFQNSE
jgi:hypothetical protein